MDVGRSFGNNWLPPDNLLPRRIAVIGYVTLGTKVMPRAAAFYDALLGEMGARDEGAPGPRGEGFYAGFAVSTATS